MYMHRTLVEFFLSFLKFHHFQLSSERFGQHQINKDTEEIIDRLEIKLDDSEKDNVALRARIKALLDRNKELQAALEAVRGTELWWFGC